MSDFQNFLMIIGAFTCFGVLALGFWAIILLAYLALDGAQVRRNARQKVRLAKHQSSGEVNDHVSFLNKLDIDAAEQDRLNNEALDVLRERLRNKSDVTMIQPAHMSIRKQDIWEQEELDGRGAHVLRMPEPETVVVKSFNAKDTNESRKSH